jgi:hypothetical protein
VDEILTVTLRNKALLWVKMFKPSRLSFLLRFPVYGSTSLPPTPTHVTLYQLFLFLIFSFFYSKSIG